MFKRAAALFVWPLKSKTLTYELMVKQILKI